MPVKPLLISPTGQVRPGLESLRLTRGPGLPLQLDPCCRRKAGFRHRAME